jgi:hypothetical protein
MRFLITFQKTLGHSSSPDYTTIRFSLNNRTLRVLRTHGGKLTAHEEQLFACRKPEADYTDHYNSDEGQPGQFVWLSEKEHPDQVGARRSDTHPNGI